MRFTYDTGAAVTAFPLDARMGEETEANEATYKTASGEIIKDQGGLKVQGATEARHRVVLTAAAPTCIRSLSQRAVCIRRAMLPS